MKRGSGGGTEALRAMQNRTARVIRVGWMKKESNGGTEVSVLQDMTRKVQDVIG